MFQHQNPLVLFNVRVRVRVRVKVGLGLGLGLGAATPLARACLSGHKVRWWEYEGCLYGAGELSYALWGHVERPRRAPDGPDGLGRATRRSPVRVRG